MISLPGYRIDEVIYESPANLLFRGVRLKDGLPVIIKTPRGNYSSVDTINRLKREYEILRALDSPFIIKVLDLSSVNGSMAAVFEDFQGQLLSNLIKNEPFNLERLLILSCRIAQALETVHRANIVHLSLNPKTILMDPKTDRLKLIDFGLAINLDLEAPKVSNQHLFMTDPAYVSPEQTGKIPLPVDHRSDLYALGAIMYELAAGRPPFEGDDPWDLAWSQLAQSPMAPHEVQPRLPKQLSRIIEKLLAKEPDERYFNAETLERDLDECRNLFSQTGRIDEFPIQWAKATEKFQLSQKLYGRDNELEALGEAFDDVRSGAGRMVLVSGFAGIGKTSLVNEIQRKVIERGGWFVSGKFDQFLRNKPYTGLMEALTQLVGRLYCVREADLNLWLGRIQEALGDNAGVMTDFLPELENLLGPQASPAGVGPLEARNRFHYVFNAFIHQFCRPEQPLVIFLDDLQWVDQATLQLIEALLARPDTGHLLIFGAYRDNEVDSNHVLTRIRNQMKSRGLKVDRVSLGALGLPDVTRFIQDSFIMESAEAAGLAHFVFGHTGGNPFYINQLLRSLHAEGILEINPGRQQWKWAPEKAEKLDLSEDVLGFLSARIARLPLDTQKALALAACVGFDFDLAHLSFIGNQSPLQTYNHLFPALRAGFILPRSKLAPADPDNIQSPLVVHEYRFLHDRMGQTAYGLLDEAERKQVHLTVGRRLLETLNEDERRERVFEITDHLNKGLELIEDGVEKISLAGMNLEAGMKAESAQAFDAAAAYLSTARSLLPPDSWQEEYGPTFSLYRESARVESLNGNFRDARDLIDTCLDRAESDWDRVRAYSQAIFKNTVEGNVSEIVPLGKAALKLLGLELPDEITPELLEKEQLEVMHLIGDRPIASLADLPVNPDPKWKLAMEIINAVGKIVSMHDHALTAWLAYSVIKLMLQNGIFKDAITLFAVYGNMQLLRGNIDLGYDFGLLSVELSTKYDVPEQKCFIHGIFAQVINPWKNHIRYNAPYLEEGFRAGLAAGEYIYASWCISGNLFQALFQGKSLKVVKDDLNELLSFTNSMNIQYSHAFCLVLNSAIKNLSGSTHDRFCFDTEEIAEKPLLDLITGPYVFFLYLFYILKSEALYLYNRFTQANILLDNIEIQKIHISGTLFVTEYYLYHTLVLTALFPEASPEDQKRYEEKIREYLRMLKFSASHCPENFSCRSLLVEAETARIKGREMEAAGLYEEAISSAVENEFTQVEALANELAARFWLAHGHARIARMYLVEAYNGWQRWGARRKVEVFEDEFQDYLQPGSTAAAPLPGGASAEANVPGYKPEPRGRNAVIKAAQTISGEMDLDRLMARLMDIMVKYSGAQKCFIICNENNSLIVRAREDIEQQGFVSCSSRLVDECPDLCGPIAYLVARSRKPLVLGDAANEGDFARDDYIRKNRVRSLLCLPVISQGNVTALLYLENNALPGIFTPDRLEILEILAAQAAISIDNARLYANLTKQTQNLEEANAALKVLLAERDKDRSEQEKNLLATLRQIVFPYTEKLKGTKLSREQKTFLDVLESNLQDLTSSYARHLASPEFGLTPMEIQVAELIKVGRTSDEIAELLHVSPGTISFHRTNIRTKLGLIGKKINLRSHLLSVMKE